MNIRSISPETYSVPVWSFFGLIAKKTCLALKGTPFLRQEHVRTISQGDKNSLTESWSEQHFFCRHSGLIDFFVSSTHLCSLWGYWSPSPFNGKLGAIKYKLELSGQMLHFQGSSFFSTTQWIVQQKAEKMHWSNITQDYLEYCSGLDKYLTLIHQKSCPELYKSSRGYVGILSIVN